MKKENEEEKQQTVYNQMAWILNYQPTIEHQHNFVGGKPSNEDSDADTEVDSDTESSQSMEQRVKACIDTLWEEKVLKHLYDYTWVMETMNQTERMPHFDTPTSFIAYLENIGIERRPSDDSINKKQNVFSGTFPNWVFTDCDYPEATRRINVGKRFLSLYRKK